MNLFLLVVGLCVGSFLGALTYRYPRKASILKGRSKCDSCGKKISWFDNIPLLSYLLLLGRCRTCKKHISFRYPLIEVITAFGFYVIGLNIFGLVLYSVLVSIFIIDLEHQIIPDAFIFFGIVVTATFIFATNETQLIPSLLSGFMAAAVLLVIYLLTAGRGMGLGDVKFAILGGLIVGLHFSLVWLFLAFLTGALVGIILILTKEARLKDKIAFGPFLVGAIPLTLIWGQRFIDLIGLSPH